MNWAALLGFILACQAIGFLGSLPNIRAIPTWYRSLRRPSWTPPNRVFAPVWTFLYLVMAIAAWRCWMITGFASWATPFAIQMALNLAWSWIFFGWKRLAVAALEMAFLWGAIVWSIAAMTAVDRVAGILLLPYLLWVSFAFTLDVGFWLQNRPVKATQTDHRVS